MTIRALRARRRESIPPQILHMLDMLRVISQLTNQTGIVRARIVPERLLPLEHDHRQTVRSGFGFFECLAHARHGLHRRRVFGTHRHGLLSADLLKRWDSESHKQSQRHPRQDDEQRKLAARPRYEGDLTVSGAHAAFNKQTANASTSYETASAFITTSTTKRQPMLPLSPCTTSSLWLLARPLEVPLTRSGFAIRREPVDGAQWPLLTDWQGGGALVAATRTTAPAARRSTAS